MSGSLAWRFLEPTASRRYDFCSSASFRSWQLTYLDLLRCSLNVYLEELVVVEGTIFLVLPLVLRLLRAHFRCVVGISVRSKFAAASRIRPNLQSLSGHVMVEVDSGAARDQAPAPQGRYRSRLTAAQGEPQGRIVNNSPPPPDHGWSVHCSADASAGSSAVTLNKLNTVTPWLSSPSERPARVPTPPCPPSPRSRPTAPRRQRPADDHLACTAQICPPRTS